MPRATCWRIFCPHYKGWYPNLSLQAWLAQTEGKLVSKRTHHLYKTDNVDVSFKCHLNVLYQQPYQVHATTSNLSKTVPHTTQWQTKTEEQSYSCRYVPEVKPSNTYHTVEWTWRTFFSYLSKHSLLRNRQAIPYGMAYLLDSYATTILNNNSYVL